MCLGFQLSTIYMPPTPTPTGSETTTQPPAAPPGLRAECVLALKSWGTKGGKWSLVDNASAGPLVCQGQEVEPGLGHFSSQGAGSVAEHGRGFPEA